MLARLRGLSHRSSIHSVVIKGNSAWMPTAIPAASPRVTSNPDTSAMSQRRICMTGDQPFPAIACPRGAPNGGVWRCSHSFHQP